MSADPTQLEAPELNNAVTTAVWEISEGRHAEYRRLLILLFGPRGEQPEPEYG